MKTLYVTDLDGTLLTSKEKVSPYSRDKLNMLTERGLLLSFATARSALAGSTGLPSFGRKHRPALFRPKYRPAGAAAQPHPMKKRLPGSDLLPRQAFLSPAPYMVKLTSVSSCRSYAAGA